MSRKLSKQTTTDSYHEAEKLAYQQLFEFIRDDLFVKPRVESQNSLLLKLISYMDTEIRQHTKKNFRRNLQREFNDSLRFVNVDGRVFVTPDNFTFDELLAEYVRTNSKLEEFIKKDDDSDDDYNSDEYEWRSFVSTFHILSFFFSETRHFNLHLHVCLFHFHYLSFIILHFLGTVHISKYSCISQRYYNFKGLKMCSYYCN